MIMLRRGAWLQDVLIHTFEAALLRTAVEADAVLQRQSSASNRKGTPHVTTHAYANGFHVRTPAVGSIEARTSTDVS